MPTCTLSLPTIAFFLSLLVFEPSYYTVLPLIAAALHECGHLMMMLACRRRVRHITILPFGLDIACAPALSSYRSDLAVALGGVLANVLAVLFCLPHLAAPRAAVFCTANLLLAVTNLLPVASLDGGAALRVLLSLFLSPARADKIARGASFCGVLFLWLVACDILLVTGYHFSLFAMAVFLFASLFLPQRKAEQSSENREENADFQGKKPPHSA